jgi:hypothetical protein
LFFILWEKSDVIPLYYTRVNTIALF